MSSSSDQIRNVIGFSPSSDQQREAWKQSIIDGKIDEFAAGEGPTTPAMRLAWIKGFIESRLVEFSEATAKFEAEAMTRARNHYRVENATLLSRVRNLEQERKAEANLLVRLQRLEAREVQAIKPPRQFSERTMAALTKGVGKAIAQSQKDVLKQVRQMTQVVPHE